LSKPDERASCLGEQRIFREWEERKSFLSFTRIVDGTPSQGYQKSYESFSKNKGCFYKQKVFLLRTEKRCV